GVAEADERHRLVRTDVERAHGDRPAGERSEHLSIGLRLFGDARWFGPVEEAELGTEDADAFRARGKCLLHVTLAADRGEQRHRPAVAGPPGTLRRPLRTGATGQVADELGVRIDGDDAGGP